MGIFSTMQDLKDYINEKLEGDNISFEIISLNYSLATFTESKEKADSMNTKLHEDFNQVLEDIELKKGDDHSTFYFNKSKSIDLEQVWEALNRFTSEHGLAIGTNFVQMLAIEHKGEGDRFYIKDLTLLKLTFSPEQGKWLREY